MLAERHPIDLERLEVFSIAREEALCSSVHLLRQSKTCRYQHTKLEFCSSTHNRPPLSPKSDSHCPRRWESGMVCGEGGPTRSLVEAQSNKPNEPATGCRDRINLDLERNPEWSSSSKRTRLAVHRLLHAVLPSKFRNPNPSGPLLTSVSKHTFAY